MNGWNARINRRRGEVEWEGYTVHVEDLKSVATVFVHLSLNGSPFVAQILYRVLR